MTPFDLIDRARSSSRSSSTRARGWKLFGARRSMSTSEGDVRTSGASGISALRPLPSAGRLSIVKFLVRGSGVAGSSCRGRGAAFHHLAGESLIRLRPARLGVVQDDREAVTRGFAEPDVSRNHRAVYLFLEELSHVGRDLLTQIRALITHRQEHAVDIERGVERRADTPNRADE